MFFLALYLMCTFLALMIGGLAAWSDVKGMTIPNQYSVAIGALFFGAWVSAKYGADGAAFGALSGHLITAAIMFAITAALFAVRALGGADSKLLTAFGLWVGLKGLAALLLYTTLAGGGLAIAAIVIKRWRLCANAPEGSWLAQIHGGASKVPYGIAILIGALVAFGYCQFLSPHTLSIFVNGK
jgi:prepilin peptidase CpaA